MKKYIGAAVAGISCCLPGMAQKQRPNILIIEVDQQRYDCTEMTSRQLKTPNLQRLSSEGMFFRNAYSPIPTSCPARECLMSGLWPEQHHGLWNWDITFKAPDFDAPTWLEALSKTDYLMGYVGKWHVHPVRTPLDYGFDDYVPESGPYQKWRKEHNLPAVVDMKDGPMFGGYDPVGKDSTKTHWMARQAIALIRKYSETGKPWHVQLDFAEPHLPCYPSREFYDMYDADSISQWPNFGETFKNKPYIQKQQLYNWGIEDFTWDKWKQYVRRYFAMISQVDDAVGEVLDALDDMGLDGNTIVIYTSDHGDASGSHRMIDKHYVLYEEEVHIPLIIRWPGTVRPGSSCGDFVINALDLAATVCDVAGLDFRTQGSSLMPLFRGDSSEWRQYAFSNYNGQQFGLFVQRMVRSKDMKYIWNMTDTDELYDLNADPAELVNQIDNPVYSDRLKVLRKVLYESLKDRNDPVVKQDAVRRQLLEGKKL